MSYRNIDFKAKDMIDMRVLIHHKIEQVFERASLWTNIMPVKIFNDLVTFISETGMDQGSLGHQGVTNNTSNLRLPGFEGAQDYNSAKMLMPLVP